MNQLTLSHSQSIQANSIFELAIESTKDIMDRAFTKDAETQELIRILKENFPCMELPLNHYFVNGVYAREIFIPAGVLVVGKIHLEETIFMILKGELLLYSNDGVVARLAAPTTFIAPRGVRRIVVALRDTVCTAIQQTKTTYISEIEDRTMAVTAVEFKDKIASLVSTSENQLENQLENQS